VAWHDFGGFPEALYHLRYDAPGAPAVAARAIELLRAAGLDAQGSHTRPLDHGAWVPLRYLYPHADVPVTQVSMQPDMRPADALRVGRALAPLADEGVLLMGSGSVTHNLSEFRLRDAGPDPAPAPYVAAFADWLRTAIAARDLDALLDYRRRAPHAQRAHPTDEHLVPLWFAIGAAMGPRASFGAEGLNPAVAHGMLAMDAFLFGPEPPPVAN
jgi:4,5-DOPA dioxygenase extradiol